MVEGYVFLLLFIILNIVVIGAPILVSYFIYRLLKKKGYRKLGIGILLIVVVGEVYLGYSAVYPPDSFYKEEFEQCFKIKFPKSGEIITKDASYPDLHGDYDAAFIAQLDAKDYNNLLVLFQKDTLNKSAGDITFWIEPNSSIEKKINAAVQLYTFERQENFGEKTSLGFMKNNMIVFVYHSY